MKRSRGNKSSRTYLAWLFLRQSLAPSDLTDLMALVVPAGSTLTTVVLFLTPDALAAPLAFLLGRLVVVEADARGRLLRAEAVAGLAVGPVVAGRRRRDEQTIHVGGRLKCLAKGKRVNHRSDRSGWRETFYLVRGRNGRHLSGGVGRLVRLAAFQGTGSVCFLSQLGRQGRVGRLHLGQRRVAIEARHAGGSLRVAEDRQVGLVHVVVLLLLLLRRRMRRTRFASHEGHV